MAVLCENCYKMIRNNGKISTMFTHLQSLKMIALLGEKKENEKKEALKKIYNNVIQLCA